MLDLLHIENIAVIETADVEFHPGLNVLTGETGAGKSIVVDAISAIIGERTSRDIVRTGAQYAAVSASFSNIPQLNWFANNDIYPDVDGNITIQRKMTMDGKNNCRVNGIPVSLSQLRDLGGQILNIHGQHDSLQLMDEGYHLRFLDMFCGNEGIREEFSELHKQLTEISARIEKLSMDEAEKARKAEMLQFQISELDNAHLEAGEDERLKARREVLRNFGKVVDAVSSANAALNGGDNFNGAVSMVYDAAECFSSVSGISSEYECFYQRLNELRFQLEDVAREISYVGNALEFSPQEQDEVESRLDLLHRLGKKYGHTVEDMLLYLQNCRKQLQEIEQSDEEIQRLEREREKIMAQTMSAALKLSENRQENAHILEERILKELLDLDMGKIRFEIELSAKELDTTGIDAVRFLMSANAGEALKAINKIASGGELSRIILAMKNVLAEKEPITTMVFDEVDSGVSGRAAAKVAKKLATLSSSKQIFCVTHLPQIAAMADTHYCVEKSERDGRTYTEISLLDDAGRQQELARLTGGENPTRTMLDSAKELIYYSREYKAKIQK